MPGQCGGSGPSERSLQKVDGVSLIIKPKSDKINSVMIEADDQVWVRGGIRKRAEPEPELPQPALSKQEISERARKIIERLKGLGEPKAPDRLSGDDDPWT